MDKKKKTIVVSSIIAIVLIFVIIFLTVKLINIKKTEAVSENITMENEIENNISENKIENNVIENNSDENIVNENQDISQNEEHNTQIVDSEQEIDKQTIEKQESDQEKAINIAKKDWGKDNTVYFSFDSKDSNGNYRICVREKSTTHTVRIYIIDVNKGTFKIEE